MTRTRRPWELAAQSGDGYPAQWKRAQPKRRKPVRKTAAERDVVAVLRDAAPLLNAMLWRNNVGAFQDKFGRWVTFGLCIGSSDLIGYQTITVTPDMIGQQLAVFLAVECKREVGGETSDRQEKFIDQVRQAGARAGVARSVEDLQAILNSGEHPKSRRSD